MRSLIIMLILIITSGCSETGKFIDSKFGNGILLNTKTGEYCFSNSISKEHKDRLHEELTEWNIVNCSEETN